MAPVALTSNFTSPPGPPPGKAVKMGNGLSLDDGSATPYSATSTAVSEQGDDKLAHSPASARSLQKELVEDSLPAARLDPRHQDYYTSLIRSSAASPSTRAGSTVYSTGIELLEAFAVQNSEAVWVYDDAAQVGFGESALSWAKAGVKGVSNVYALQTREGAGLELAGYVKRRQGGKVSVFASTATLPYLLPNLDKIKGDVVIHLASTAPAAESLELSDSLGQPGVLKSLANLPPGWQVVFSGDKLVDTVAKLYGSERKVVHVVESTYLAREEASYVFPVPNAGDLEDFHLSSEANKITVTLPGRSIVVEGSVLTLNTLSPNADALFAALTAEIKKEVTIVGLSTAEVNAMKSVILTTLYSASGSSKTILPNLTTKVLPSRPAQPANGKSVAFYTAPLSPLPQLVSHLFGAAPTLSTGLARFGSSTVRGLKSVVSLHAASTSASLRVNQNVDVAWVSDANVHKSTDFISSLRAGGLLVLELPWIEEEVPVKLTRLEIQTIKEKQIRVFLLDLDQTSPLAPIHEQIAFLLLYTGKQRLPLGVQKVLEAFHSGHIEKEQIENAEAALSELDVASWKVPELKEGKVDKIKPEWSWDAVPGQPGIVEQETKPTHASWELPARHLLFREAFAVSDAQATSEGPAIDAVRPSMADETFVVSVTENRRLTPQTYDRNVFHLELDTAGTGLKYEIGEAIGIHGWNDTQEVLDFCKWYGLEPDSLVSFPNPLMAGTMETRSVFQLLQQNIDLFGRPGKEFYAALAKLATTQADRMILQFIAAPEGAELFKRMAENETVTFADVLYKFRTARPDIDALVTLIPEIKPRHYSIASSQKAIGDKVELLIVTVDWLNSKGSPRFGQCTRYLAGLKLGDKVTVSIKPSVMKLPPSDLTPIIMAGLGTGAAPFRAFMQHRAWQRSQGLEVGPLIYYFGSRYRSQEYLYGEEIEAYIASGIISHAGLAFSRDGKDKVYIQHKMGQDKKMLADLLTAKGEQGAYFYLCGPTWPVPDVYEALTTSLEGEKAMKREAAEAYIEELKEAERYVLEVY